MSAPATKLSLLQAAITRADWNEALRIAARFPDLGHDDKAIRRAHECLNAGRGAFFRQLGLDPDTLIADGKAALVKRYVTERASTKA